MSHSNRVVVVTPPVQSENLYAMAGDTFDPSDFIVVPDSWKNSVLTIRALGSASWLIVFGGASLASVAALAESAYTGDEPAPDDGGYLVSVGDPPLVLDLSLVNDPKKERMALFCSGGAGTDFLEVLRSSGMVA